MGPWIAHNPVRVRFGPGSLDALGGAVGERRALVLMYPEAVGGPLEARVRAILGERCTAVAAASGANPRLADLRDRNRSCADELGRAACIVAVGGGSTIDLAKALALRSADGSPDALIDALRSGTTAAALRALPVIAVPTTAGTGSEVTPWATLWDTDWPAPCKRSLHRDDTWPEAALVDPDLSAGCPPSLVLASGLDALSHALESIWNRHATPFSDALAVPAARAVLRFLPRRLHDPGDAHAREALAQAALFAGLAFSQTRTALAHALSYDITLQRGTPHGIACSFSLPEVWRRAARHDAARDSVLAQVLPAAVDDAPHWLGRWLAGLGVSTRFEDYGIADPDAAIGAVLDSERGRNFIGAGT